MLSFHNTPNFLCYYLNEFKICKKKKLMSLSTMQFTVSDFSPETFTPLYLMFVAHIHLPLKHFFLEEGNSLYW